MQELLFVAENRDNIWSNLMHLKKGVMDCKLEHLKIVTLSWIPAYKDYWRWKVYILNKCFYSNWQTIYPRLKYPHNGPHIKVPLIFWFLIITFNLCFHHQLLIKWVCIHIEQTHLRFPKHLWMFDTELNAHQISILDNLRN